MTLAGQGEAVGGDVQGVRRVRVELEMGMIAGPVLRGLVAQGIDGEDLADLEPAPNEVQALPGLAELVIHLPE